MQAIPVCPRVSSILTLNKYFQLNISYNILIRYNQFTQAYRYTYSKINYDKKYLTAELESIILCDCSIIESTYLYYQFC